MDFHKKRVLVCGMAQSGISAAKLLAELGAEVTAQDIKEEEKLDLKGLPENVRLYLGKNPDALLDDERFDLLLLSPGVPCDLPFVEKAKALGIPVWGEIELAYTLCPCGITAITGTNGKTTTTALTGEIMKLFNPQTEVVGNIGVPFTEKVAALTAQSYVVAEVSSFQLETTHTFKPHISAVLNITPDHLNRHKTVENYQAAKELIFQNQQADDFCVLNYDDLACREMSARVSARVVFFSRIAQLDDGVFVKDGAIYVKTRGIDESLLPVGEMQIFGSHNVENALAAVAMGVCAGVPLATIRSALMSFKGVEHRLEYVRTLNGIDFYNDSKGTNPDAAIKALLAIQKPIVLIGGGYDKHSDFSDWVKLFGGRVRHLVVLGAVADQIIDTCKAYGFTDYTKVNTLRDAVELSYGSAQPGDCVLLSPACASWDMFDNFEQRGTLFKQFVCELE